MGTGTGEDGLREWALCVVADGTLLESASIVSLKIMRGAGSGLVSLALEAPSDLHYTIQSSADLASWRDLVNTANTLPTRIISFPVSSERQFFRAYVP